MPVPLPLPLVQFPSLKDQKKSINFERDSARAPYMIYGTERERTGATGTHRRGPPELE